jgi:hypothetical protein
MTQSPTLSLPSTLPTLKSHQGHFINFYGEWAVVEALEL